MKKYFVVIVFDDGRVTREREEEITAINFENAFSKAKENLYSYERIVLIEED